MLNIPISDIKMMNFMYQGTIDKKIKWIFTVMIMALYFVGLSNVDASYFSKAYDALESGVEKSSRFVGLDKIIQTALLPGAFAWGSNDNKEQIKLKCLDGVSLAGEYIEKNPGGLTIVFFHGNGMTHQSWGSLKFFSQQNLNVLSFTIRGYGNSQGTCDEIAYSSALDVEAAMRFLIEDKNIPQKKIMTYGMSLGGGYATYAARYFGTPTILNNTFTSIGNVIEDQTFWIPSTLCGLSRVITVFPQNSDVIVDFLCLPILCGLLSYSIDRFTPLNLGGVAIPGFIKNGIAKAFLNKQCLPEVENLGLFHELGHIPPNTFDNLVNLENTSSETPVLIMYGKQDSLMGERRRALQLHAFTSKQFSSTFENLVELQGGHCTLGFDNFEGKNSITEFIQLQSDESCLHEAVVHK